MPKLGLDSPKVDCSCCDKSCHFWDPVFNPTATNTKCRHENILDFNDYGIYPTYIKDLDTNDTTDGYYGGICISPTGCYQLIGEDWTKNRIEKELYFGYSNTSNSIVQSDPQNAICDAVNICGNSIDSSHPRRRILNYFMQTLISNSSILYDTASYEHKALCWMMGDENDVGTIDDLDELVC